MGQVQPAEADALPRQGFEVLNNVVCSWLSHKDTPSRPAGRRLWRQWPRCRDSWLEAAIPGVVLDALVRAVPQRRKKQHPHSTSQPYVTEPTIVHSKILRPWKVGILGDVRHNDVPIVHHKAQR